VHPAPGRVDVAPPARLKIGYGRAARIIDQLHLAGVLGPPDGSKPRDVMVGIEELHRLGNPDRD
jgi:S-DNA-T family DNA segregation ATPase FtsK/SpoIIIE